MSFLKGLQRILNWFDGSPLSYTHQPCMTGWLGDMHDSALSVFHPDSTKHSRFLFWSRSTWQKLP